MTTYSFMQEALDTMPDFVKISKVSSPDNKTHYTRFHKIGNGYEVDFSKVNYIDDGLNSEDIAKITDIDNGELDNLTKIKKIVLGEE